MRLDAFESAGACPSLEARIVLAVGVTGRSPAIEKAGADDVHGRLGIAIACEREAWPQRKSSCEVRGAVAD